MNACSVPRQLLQIGPATAGQLPGVNVSGYFASEKGVGEGVRADIRALAAAGIPFVLNNITDPGSENRDSELSAFVSENPYSVNLIHVGPDTIHEVVHKLGPAYFANRYNIAFWAWELPEFPHDWNPRFGHLDEIWVPSSFVRKAISSASPVTVRTIPHCLIPPAVTVKNRSCFGIPEQCFVFMFAFDFQSCAERKNPMGLISAFRRAFTPTDNAILILKCSHGDHAASEVEALRTAADGTRIIILDRVLSRCDMSDLMNLIDCYVSLHRSEGFGLTLAEAMSLGKPVIATDYSGNLDFMSSENSFLVPCSMVAIRQDAGHYRKGSTWAEPDAGHAASLMRYVFENRDEAVAVGRRAQSEVLTKLSPSSVGEIIRLRLRDIAARQTVGQQLARSGPECSIVIPVYNHASLTRQCLEALFAVPASAVNFEVIVADDASTDGTHEALQQYGNRIRVLTCSKNSGFANTCNAGAAIATAEWLLFLNNDTIPQPGWLDSLICHSRRHPRAAIVGSRLLFPDGTIQHAGVVVGKNGYPYHIHVGYRGDHPAVCFSRQFQAVTGACMLVRRSFFEETGGFDPAFTNGFEDIDLCLRARSHGFEVHYCHESVLFHLQSATRAGRPEEELRNCRVYQARWGGRVEQDDLEYLARDGAGILDDDNLPPAHSRAAPRAAPTRPEGWNSDLPGMWPVVNTVLPRPAPPRV